MKFFENKTNRLGKTKCKAFTLVEVLVACAIVVLMTGVLVMKLTEARATAKIAQMQSEMNSLVTACLSYETLNINAELPATLEDLNTGLTAAKSIDHCPHDSFITSDRDFSDGVTDPWGNAYNYSKTSRTISCTPKDSAGNDLETVTKNF